MCSDPQSRPFCAQVHFNLLCCWMGLTYVSSHVIFNRRFLLMLRGSKCSINSLNDRSWCSPQRCSAGWMGKERMAFTGADVLVGFDGLSSPKAFLHQNPLPAVGPAMTLLSAAIWKRSVHHMQRSLLLLSPQTPTPLPAPAFPSVLVSLCFHFLYIICYSLNVSHTQSFLSAFLVSTCAPG